MPAITRDYLLARKSALEEQHRNLMFQAAQVHGAMQDVNDMLTQLDAPEPTAEPDETFAAAFMKGATAPIRPAPDDYPAVEEKAA